VEPEGAAEWDPEEGGDDAGRGEEVDPVLEGATWLGAALDAGAAGFAVAGLAAGVAATGLLAVDRGLLAVDFLAVDALGAARLLAALRAAGFRALPALAVERRSAVFVRAFLAVERFAVLRVLDAPLVFLDLRAVAIQSSYFSVGPVTRTRQMTPFKSRPIHAADASDSVAFPVVSFNSAGRGPPVAQSSNSTVWTTGVGVTSLS
jgi:hypothetical protein